MSEWRNARQRMVWDWGVRAFGLDHMTNCQTRGIRFAEEAIELAQAAGVDKEKLHKLIDFVYARPVGEIYAEIGGVGVTLLALSQSLRVSADAAEQSELERVLAKPATLFSERNEAKIAAGFE